MKTFLLYSIVICFAVIVIYLILFDVTNYNHLHLVQRETAESVLTSFEKAISKKLPEEKALIDYDSLLSELSLIQRSFVSNIFNIKPSELGFKGTFYSKDKPGGLIKIESVSFSSGRETGIQYLPVHVYADYEKMIRKMEADIGKRLYVDSGYRSPGRQAYLFFYYLVKSSDYSLYENAKWIAMPGYSEHGHPVNTAIDFCNEEGINGFSQGQSAEDFIILPEYHWLLANAAEFNFWLSYPEGNDLGVAFEPWHWHWDNSRPN
jgi:LAS superfamily LD-carboxypeptidase LdcB